MPASKRYRDPEEAVPFPAHKQSKLEDFFDKAAFTIPTKNRFSPLDDCECDENTEGENVEPDPVVGQTDPVPPREEEITSRESTQLTLIARTVEFIFQQIGDIASQITQVSKEVHSLLDYNKQALTEHQSTKVKWRQQEQTPLKSNSHLIFQPKKICMTICGRPDQTPNWKGVQRSKQHLSDLLGIGLSEIDLVGTESLYTANQTQKIMLTFSSIRLPLLIHKLKYRLSSKGVFPTRVFHNSIVVPLCRMRSCAIERHTKPKSGPPTEARTPQKDLIGGEETDISELNLQNQAQHQNNKVSQKEQLIPPDNHLQEFEHSVNPWEDDFLSSFRNLPQEEQQTVIKRLDLMSQTLKEIKEPEVEADNRLNGQNRMTITEPLEYWIKMRYLEEEEEEESGTMPKELPLVSNLQRKGPVQTNESPVTEDASIHQHDPNYSQTHSSMPDLESSSILDQTTSNLQMNTQKSPLPASSSPRGPRSPKPKRDDPIVMVQDSREVLIEDPLGHINKLIQPSKEKPITDPSLTSLNNTPLHPSTFSRNLTLPGPGSTTSGMSIPSPQLNHSNRTTLPGSTAHLLPSQRKITDFFGALNSDPLFNSN